MGALVSDPSRSGDVIVAPATPPGVSALAAVRLSGPEGRAVAILGALAPRLGSDVPERTAILARLVHADGEPLDDAVALVYRAPRSPTGEEVVELFCHGSPAVVDGVLAAACRAGARPAGPGEFTRRALANGKLDLCEAEGIARLASAETRAEARRSLSLVRGELSGRLAGVRERALDLLAALEASLDFAEDVAAPGAGTLLPELEALAAEVRSLAASAERARPDGPPRVVLAGRPNAGKSTLFNALLGRDRAIVTARAGTTRDAVSETAELAGVRVTLVDTAGLRESEDEVERIGVDVARRAAAGADVVVYLVDGVADAEIPAGALVVETKCDLSPASGVLRADARVSARTGEGLAALAALVAARVRGADASDGPLVLARHGEALSRAAAAFEDACIAARAGRDAELVAADVRRALFALGEVTGETATEELLDRIFASFCIGK